MEKLQKRELVNSLKNVKIVLGNGFDLHCGLHTLYRDYYCKNYDLFVRIQKLFKKYRGVEPINDLIDDESSKWNVWDIFFALNSSTHPRQCRKNWCDIEKLMYSSFVDLDSAKDDSKELIIASLSSINWRRIKKHVMSQAIPSDITDSFVVRFINYKMTKLELNQNDFYSFLLNELKTFEIKFGLFIYRNLNYLPYGNNSYVVPNEKYTPMALHTLNDLYDGKPSSIDTFNFSVLEDPELKDSIRNINGTYEQPIFGIDSVFEPDDECFIFTKTSRRMEADTFDNAYNEQPPFDNLIIYGHSLNEADYSYFFPAFDQIKLDDILADGKIVFAYSIYKKEEEGKILSNLRSAISNIVVAYAKSKNISDPSRFLDRLSIQRRIVMFEIPELDPMDFPASHTDIGWFELYKRIDELD